ncbi:MAG TPA: radical SAM/SPASM domain-containing protein [Pirellulaceae bacterium]|nr:radical SAM/SPASM domain-containing protein [Pirellulaceae bacterium]
MYLRLAKRVLLETDKRLVWKAIWNLGWKGMWAIQKHKARLKRGEFFPPFLYISVINSCNLRCQGCWVDVAAKQSKIEVEAMDRLITESKAMGNSFFGILGGEPFMHPQLMQIFERHPDCYFQVFTNGQFITDEVARDLRRVGNVTPLISVEGNEIISDERRGRAEVFNKTMEGLRNCLKHKVLTGVCTSLCQTNFDLLSEAWVDRLIEMGVMYCWFHIYRVVGPAPTPDLALTPAQQQQARKFVVEMRAKKPIVIIDAYYDGEGQALCPAATGFTHHVSPWGDIEPCPVIQFAKESIYDKRPDGSYRPLRETLNESAFLRDFRETAAQSTRGCIILERPDLLEGLVDRHSARDTTARGSAMPELQALTTRPSQYHPGNEIPEKSLAYRLVKKFFFNDYGAYGKHFRKENWRETRQPDDTRVVEITKNG